MTNEVMAFIGLAISFCFLLYLYEKRYNKAVVSLNAYRNLYVNFFVSEVIRVGLIPNIIHIKNNLSSIIQENDFDHDMYSGDYGGSETREFHPSDEECITEIDDLFEVIIKNLYMIDSYDKHMMKKLKKEFNQIRETRFAKDQIKDILDYILEELYPMYYPMHFPAITERNNVKLIIDENEAINTWHKSRFWEK